MPVWSAAARPTSLTTALVAALLVFVPAAPTAARTPPTAALTAPGIDGELVAAFVDTDDGGEIKIETFDPADPTLSADNIRTAVDADPASRTHPSFSPGGQVAYSDQDTDAVGDPQRIFTIVPGTSDETALPSTRLADYEPAWSPAGDRIAFTTQVGSGSATCTNRSATGSRIAYSAEGDLWTTPGDGSAVTRLTNSPDFEGGPSWTGDGTRLGFWRSGGPSVDMFSMSVDGSVNGGSVSPLPSTATADDYGPVFNPVDGRLLYVSLAGGDPEIFVRPASGGVAVQLTDNAAVDTSPEWSCDGTRIVFASDRAGNLDLFTMKPDGSGVSNLTGTAWSENDPTYSPTGNKIAYTSNQHGDFDVMVMKSDGTDAADPLHLTTSSAHDVQPTWSPDGTSLAFSSDRTERAQIYAMSATTPQSERRVRDTEAIHSLAWGSAPPATYVYTMQPDGTDPQPVTLPISGGNPAWSPTGARIVFSDAGDLFTIQPNGQGLERLTADHNNTGRDIEPSWSPDGSKVVYVGVDASGKSSLWTVNVAGGTGLFRLTTGPTDRSPVWSPSGTRIAFIRGGEAWTINPDGTGATRVREILPASYVSLDWGTGGVPDTLLTQKPGAGVGNEATFRFTASRFPATFECRLSSSSAYPGLHDWQDCGSMATAGATQPTRSYFDLSTGRYTFAVRASNDQGTDESPATHQFEASPGGLTVTKLGTGLGTVKGDRSGISCEVGQEQCQYDVRGEVRLTAKAQSGSVFKRWSGACSGSEKTCTVTLRGKPVFANARFELASGLPSCASQVTRKVGSWTVRGCFKGSGSSVSSSGPVLVNGLHVLPIGGTLTLDTAAQRLTASGRAQVSAGPASSGGAVIDAIVLYRDTFEMDLAQPELALISTTTEILGVPVDPVFLAASDGNQAATISATTDLPMVLGGGDALVQLRTSDSGNGLDVGSIRMGRQVENGSAEIESPFAAAIGDFFTVKEVLVRYDPARRWVISGSLDMASGGGGVEGRLDFAGGALRGGEFRLRRVPIAGLLTVPQLNISSVDAENWTMESISTSRVAGSPVQRTKHGGCGEQIARRASGFKVPSNPFEVVKLINFKIEVPRCQLWGNSVVVKNLAITLSTFPPGFAVSGDLAGRLGGQFTGLVTLDRRSASVSFPKLAVDELLTMHDTVLTWQTDGRLDTWTGQGALNAPDGPPVTMDVRTVGGELEAGTVAVSDLKIFELVQNDGTSTGVIDVKKFSLNYVPASRSWSITGEVDLPGVRVGPFRGNVTFDADGNVATGSLHVERTLLLGYFEASALDLTLTRPGAWSGSTYVALPGLAGASARVAVVDGRLDSLGADLTFVQPLPIALIPKTGLYRLGFALQNDPPTLAGSLGMQAGPTLFGKRPVTADGTFTARFPTQSQNPGFRVDGDVAVMGLPLGDGHVDYGYPASLDIEGCLGTCADGLVVGPARVTARVRGQLQGQPFAFQLEGQAAAGLEFPTPCFLRCGVLRVEVVGQAVVSSVGMAACGGIQGMGDWTAGVGWKWSGGPSAFTGCDLGAYEAFARAARLKPASSLRPGDVSSLRVPVPAGLPVQAFRFKGETAPPLIDLTRPGGGTISTSAENLGQHDDYLLVVDEDTKETIILVDTPAAGEWAVSLQDGSSALRKASTSEGLAPADVTGAVTGAGSTRTLTYDITPQAGQEVQLVETGADTSQVIVESATTSGSTPFIPAPGPGGPRTILAIVTQDGLPRTTIELTTYTAPNRSVLAVARTGSGSGRVMGEGISCGETCVVDLNGDVTLQAAAGKGSRFVGWTGACGGTSTCLVPGDGGTTTVGAAFEKLVKPRISSLSPQEAKVGGLVTVKGSGFLGATKVKVGSRRAPAFTVVSATKLTFTVPRGAKTGKVTIVTPDGSATSVKKLVVTQPRNRVDSRLRDGP